MSYSTSERKSYRKGFFAGLFAAKKASKSKKRIPKMPKNATKLQRHNFLMMNDPDYLVAQRAALRDVQEIEDRSTRDRVLEENRRKYYREVKKKTPEGWYLTSKFGDID